MTWIQTYTGKRFTPLDPQPDQICIEDIAHALSLQCRYSGHCRAFYSVAEHSMRVSQIVPAEHQFAGLMHDAAEAYMGDMASPIKQMFPEFKRMENQIMKVVCEVFGIEWPLDPSVKIADNIMLATEARDLMVSPPEDWHLLEEPQQTYTIPVSSAAAEQMFLQMFHYHRPADAD